MTRLSKRDLLLALAAIGATVALPATAQEAEYAAAQAIGAAYMAAQPNTDLRAARAALLPNGFSDAALPALKARVAADFQAGSVFDYRGWRLSHTEGQLFALLTHAL